MSGPVLHVNASSAPTGADEPKPPGLPAPAAPRRAIDVLQDAGIRWSDGDSLRLAASQAYVMLLALFPLLIVILSVAHRILRDSLSTRIYLLSFIDGSNSPLIRDAIFEGIDGAQKTSGSGRGLVIGIVTGMFTAGGVFVELDTSFNRIFGFPKLTSGVRAAVQETLRERLYGALLVGGLVLLLLSTIIASTVLNAITKYLPTSVAILATVISLASSLTLLTGGLTLCYKIIPDVKVPWRSAAWGALVASVLFHLLRALFGWLTVHITSYAAYGVVGSVITVMFWFYLTGCILLFGASVTASHQGRPPALVAGVGSPKLPEGEAQARSASPAA